MEAVLKLASLQSQHEPNERSNLFNTYWCGEVCPAGSYDHKDEMSNPIVDYTMLFDTVSSNHLHVLQSTFHISAALIFIKLTRLRCKRDLTSTFDHFTGLPPSFRPMFSSRSCQYRKKHMLRAQSAKTVFRYRIKTPFYHAPRQLWRHIYFCSPSICFLKDCLARNQNKGFPKM